MHKLSEQMLKYRPEIDGLRALAVIPVVFFHAGISGFSGGIVGVDVFFVISGYLITAILLSDLSKQRFSLLSFYARRAQRILPALIFVALCCLPFAWSWMVAEQQLHFAKSLMALSVFGSNIYFAKTTGYFDPGTDEMPLLHTWSLAVEEQFYLGFPLLLMGLWKLKKGALKPTLVMLLLGSLILAEWAWRFSEGASYYLLPTRAWELLIGALLAAGSVEPEEEGRDSTVTEAAGAFLAFLGLILIAVSVLYFQESTPHPSALTLLPVIGASLVIRFASQHNLVGRILSTKPIVKVGLVSYSAYLIHQPLFVFFRLKSVAMPEQWLMGLLAFLVFPLAYVVWRFIETPFRHGARPKCQVYGGAVLGLGLLAAMGLLTTSRGDTEVKRGMPKSVIASIKNIEKPCFNVPMTHAKRHWLCDLGNKVAGSSPPDFLLTGDSHMNSLSPSVEQWAIEHGYSGQYVGYRGCPPVLGVHVLRSDQALKNCFQLNNRIHTYIREKEIKNLILISRWNFYTKGGYDAKDFTYLSLTQSGEKSMSESERIFKEQLHRTIDEYVKMGVKVHVVLQVPEQIYTPAKVYTRVGSKLPSLREEVLKADSVSFNQHVDYQQDIRALFKSLQEIYHPSLSVINPDSTFCDSQICLIGNPNESYYFDKDHISRNGALRLLPQLGRELKLGNGQSSEVAHR